MMSKIFLRNKYLRPLQSYVRIYCNTPPQGPIVKIGDKCYVPVPCPKEEKQEDLQTFMRITRGDPSKVRYSFVPEEWFQFFYQKTGTTGPYIFFISVSTYLISKEVYVMEHEYYTLLAEVILLYLVVTKVGPHFAKFLDKEVDEYEEKWNTTRSNTKKHFEESIELENKCQRSMEGQLILQEAKKENVGLQLEAAYRSRLLQTYKDVKKRLDFQVAANMINENYRHRNLIQWVVDQVLSSYTAEKDKQNIDSCMDHLSTLATKYKI